MSEINLDDVLGNVPIYEPTPIIGGNIQPVKQNGDHKDSFSRESHHTSRHSTMMSEHTIPPEPKSRATTASSVSTIKENIKPANNFLSVAPQEQSASTVDLLSQVFGAVSIEPVTLSDVPYNSHQETHVVNVHSAYDNNHHHDDAIGELDNILAGHETASSVGSQASYGIRSAPRSHHSVANSHVSNSTITRNVAHQVASDVVADSFHSLDLENNGHYDYADTPEPDYHYDQHSAVSHSRHSQYSTPQLYSDAPRDSQLHRRMTVDSCISTAETRYGDYELVESDDINLNHDDVAYKRLKHKHHHHKSSSKALPVQNNSAMQAELNSITRQLQEANAKKQLLAQQLERSKSDVERLKLQKQRDIARDAAQKVGGVHHHHHHSTKSTNSSRSNSFFDVGSVHSYTNPDNRTASVVSRTTQSIDSIYNEEPAKISEVAQVQRDNGNLVEKVGKFSVYVPWNEEEPGYSKNNHIKKIIVGGHAAQTEDDKTVLLFGPRGCGKTSVINSILNYLFGVSKENDFRFALNTGDTKKTNDLTVYVINNTILPYSVTIVDTPGVPNVENERSNAVSTLIKSWFEEVLLAEGAFRLDAISIVLRHDEAKLEWSFIYELAAVKKMFGDDLKTNVLPIITNSEVLPQPDAIRALAAANIVFVEYYKVNNLGFQPEARGISKLQHNLFFSSGVGALENFFRDLQELIHPLLALLRGGAGKKALSTHTIDSAALY